MHDEVAATGLMTGFPPRPEQVVTLENWQQPPRNRWAFRNMREVMATQRIRRGEWHRPLDRDPHPLDDVEVPGVDGSSATFGEIIERTFTDSVVVLHDGNVVEERYAVGMRRDQPHLTMSVSKSIVGCVVATLVADGFLDPDDDVARFVPEVEGSGYDGATIRHLLDMRTGVQFREDYDDPEAEVRLMEQAMGWQPRRDDEPNGMYAYLTKLARDGDHGGSFVYRSADTDLLGWVAERAAGQRMADLIATRIWAPMGAEHDAEITCDVVGTGIHDGGVCATAVDLARFGQLLLDDGAVHGTQVVPMSWLTESRTIDSDVRQAYTSSSAEQALPGGWYRNHFWVIPGMSGDVQLCIGIYGQLVFVEHATRTVAVKLSSWPWAQYGSALVDTVRAFSAVGRELAGLPAVPADGRMGHGATYSFLTGRTEGDEAAE